MGLPKNPKFTIDKLPEVQRSKVLDALLAGASLRDVAELAGISHQAVKRYKSKVFIPAVRKAQQIQSFQPLDIPASVKVAQQTKLTKDIVQSSPFRDRLEKLWKTADETLEKAKKGVREIKDSNGKVVSIAQDLCAVAPILNQAHKNVAMLGQATGELEMQSGGNIAIQIVLPQVESSTDTRQPRPAPQTINIGITKR